MPTNTAPNRVTTLCVLRAFIRAQRPAARRTVAWSAFDLRLSMSAAVNQALIERRPFSFL